MEEREFFVFNRHWLTVAESFGDNRKALAFLLAVLRYGLRDELPQFTSDEKDVEIAFGFCQHYIDNWRKKTIKKYGGLK